MQLAVTNQHNKTCIHSLLKDGKLLKQLEVITFIFLTTWRNISSLETEKPLNADAPKAQFGRGSGNKNTSRSCHALNPVGTKAILFFLCVWSKKQQYSS